MIWAPINIPPSMEKTPTIIKNKHDNEKKTPMIIKKYIHDKNNHDNFFLFSGQYLPKISVTLHTQ